MYPVHYRSIFATLVLSVIGPGCASAALDTPSNGAANPKAHTMPIAHSTEVLDKDFDPWAEGAGTQDDAHAHHHADQPDESEADPHAHHEHMDHASDPPAAPAPSSRPTQDEDAAQHEGHDHD